MQEKDNTDPVSSGMFSDDPSFLETVRRYVFELDERLENVQAALRAEEFAELQRLCHELRDSGGGQAYPTIAQAAAELETKALSRQAHACRKALDELSDVIRQVQAGVED